jgi:hypothetical protein
MKMLLGKGAGPPVSIFQIPLASTFQKKKVTTMQALGYGRQCSLFMIRAPLTTCTATHMITTFLQPTDRGDRAKRFLPTCLYVLR